MERELMTILENGSTHESTFVLRTSVDFPIYLHIVPIIWSLPALRSGNPLNLSERSVDK